MVSGDRSMSVRSDPHLHLKTKLKLGMLKQFEEREVLERAEDPQRPEETGRVGIKPPMNRINTLVNNL
ncbi:uncharacterized protein N7518_001868 [Penicillium psychrosexuale]|uniref:uncharacterized protein n=1 Tax=Penicillium psychrosexuale TaxID=1002107 RepID=UPI0025454CBF|nr:uncharacterized protein N7518_001868 [Penicillium psychrosexuale]KAJ5799800.1 hypothetical protein N7518_001868 [Penicillium psychrosexuale]